MTRVLLWVGDNLLWHTVPSWEQLAGGFPGQLEQLFVWSHRTKDQHVARGRVNTLWSVHRMEGHAAVSKDTAGMA